MNSPTKPQAGVLPPLPLGQKMGSATINGKYTELRMHDDAAMLAYGRQVEAEVLRRAALTSGASQPEPAGALLRSRYVTTLARVAHDRQNHFSEWGDWLPTTYEHAKAVTDPARNSDPMLYEMMPLVVPQAGASQPEPTDGQVYQAVPAMGFPDAVADGSGSRSANTPLPWAYRKMRPHFAIEAANGVRVAEVRYCGRPDGSTSEDVARFIVARANTAQTQEETELTIAADSYEQIAETIGTLSGYSVQEHVGTMKEVIEACADFLHDFDESNPGAVRLAQAVRDCLRGRIDLVDLDRTED